MEILILILVAVVLVKIWDVLSDIWTSTSEATVSFAVVIAENYLLGLALLSLITGLFFIRVFRKTRKPTKQATIKEVILVKDKNGKFNEFGNHDPVEDINIENLVSKAVTFFENPEKYEDFLTGWYHRKKVDRAKLASESLTSYLSSLKQLSMEAGELQEEVYKTRELAKFRVKV